MIEDGSIGCLAPSNSHRRDGSVRREIPSIMY